MEKVNGFGIASLVLGIVGILLTCAFGLSGLFGLIGLILGILGLTVLKDSKKGLAVAGVIVSGVALFIGIGWLAIYGIRAVNKQLPKQNQGYIGGSTRLENEEYDTGKSENISSSYEQNQSQNEPEDAGTYDQNVYYDIVETGSYSNSIGSTIIIHKVKAKSDISVSSTCLAYAKDGSVIGKSSDDIVLTDGEYNYFKYTFDSDCDISNATFDFNAQPQKDSFMTGERKCVEMTQYNKSGDDLYITFKQTGDSISTFAKFKLIMYKGSEIVGTEDGYFSVYAENLSGKGSTDVAKVWVFGKDFDKIEYIFEP